MHYNALEVLQLVKVKAVAHRLWQLRLPPRWARQIICYWIACYWIGCYWISCYWMLLDRLLLGTKSKSTGCCCKWVPYFVLVSTILHLADYLQLICVIIRQIFSHLIYVIICCYCYQSYLCYYRADICPDSTRYHTNLFALQQLKPYFHWSALSHTRIIICAQNGISDIIDTARCCSFIQLIIQWP